MNMKTKSHTSLASHPVLLLICVIIAGLWIAFARAQVAASNSPIPDFVGDHLDYKNLFKNQVAKIYAEGFLSPTRRYMALENGKDTMLFLILDLHPNTNRWEVAFTHGASGLVSGYNSRMAIFHRGNQFVAVWAVYGKNTTCLRANDSSSGFQLTSYPNNYGDFSWEEDTGKILGIGTAGGVIDTSDYRVVIGSLDGKERAVLTEIERLIPGPYALRKFDESTYRLWVTKSENKLPSVDAAAALGVCALHCITLKKSPSGIAVINDKFVTKITLPVRGGLRGYFAVEDQGRTYRLILRPFPMSGEAKDQDLGEFAY